MKTKELIVGITGASGVIYSRTLLRALGEAGHNIHLIISKDATTLLERELGLHGFSDNPDPLTLLNLDRLLSPIRIYPPDKMDAPISSGTFKTDGMVIVPCSMKTLGALASGYADTLLSRCADVTLKERRRLILVPRETPLNSIHLENMLKLSRAGAVILPAAPPFYFHPQSIQDLADFIAMKILDLLDIPHRFHTVWKPEEDR